LIARINGGNRFIDYRKQLTCNSTLIDRDIVNPTND
jgi:hypothetical protein